MQAGESESCAVRGEGGPGPLRNCGFPSSGTLEICGMRGPTICPQTPPSREECQETLSLHGAKQPTSHGLHRELRALSTLQDQAFCKVNLADFPGPPVPFAMGILAGEEE